MLLPMLAASCIRPCSLRGGSDSAGDVTAGVGVGLAVTPVGRGDSSRFHISSHLQGRRTRLESKANE
jgi:hypothetical protein